MRILKGHMSPETAYLVNDYPFGFRLRCKIRYWLEYKPKKGFRFMSQTTDPRRGNITWNKPKASTYYLCGACMYLDDKEHVQWTALSEYCDAAEARKFLETYQEGIPEVGLPFLRKFIAGKEAYAANRNPDDPLSVGLAAAHKAFRETE